nr:unnamed protein product [Callosobruchus analis]
MNHAFINNSVLTLPCICILKCTTYVKRNLSEFISLGNYHSYDTRSELLSVPIHKTSCFEKSTYYMDIQMVNSDLLSVYWALAYSYMSNNIATWGLASQNKRIFIAQKKIV